MTLDPSWSFTKIRLRNKSYFNFNLEPEITIEEISNSLKKCKARKSSGMDGFHLEIITTVWRIDKGIIYNLFNSCLRNMIFPKEWESAKLKIIVKHTTKDRSLLNSYRPIALLPVLGKVFERIIVNRIQALYKSNNLENNRQFGFGTGKSTEDALVTLKTGIIEAEIKYVMVIFLR